MPQKGHVLLLLLQLALSNGQWGLESIGPRIQQEVQESLQPLKEQLRGLEGLGDRINQQVYEGLKPVRVMESMMKVRFGNGGVTVATFAPSGRQLIVRNGENFVCSGNINMETGECAGTEEKMRFLKDEDFCFATSKSVINDWYCIAPDSNFRTISYINGKIICETSDNSPRLLIEKSKFHNMCKNVATMVIYKHFTMTPLTEIGNEMRCSGKQPQVCSFSEKLQNFNSVYTVING